MDLGTLFGLIVAFGALTGAVLMEGGSLRALLSMPALVIVFGGTLGATLVSVPLKDFVRLPHLLRLSVFPHSFNHAQSAREIVRLANVCAVNSCAAELRENGIDVRCKQRGRHFYYRLVTRPMTQGVQFEEGDE